MFPNRLLNERARLCSNKPSTTARRASQEVLPRLRVGLVWCRITHGYLAPAIILFILHTPLVAGEKKQPLPSTAAVKKAESLVHELYESEYKLAKQKPAEKARLAEIFLQEGRDTRDFPAGRFVLFREARDLSADVGSVTTALQAVEELALSFQMKPADVFLMKLQTLTTAARAKVDADSYRSVADAALILLEDALAADNYRAATRLLNLAENAGIKLRSVPLVTQIRRRQAEVMRLKKVYDQVHPFVTALEKNADDAQANLAVGKYHAFTKNNWRKGLPHLTRSSDGNIKQIAALDLAAPTNAKQQAAVADGWRQIAQQLKGDARALVLLRAYQWYQKADWQLQGKERRAVAHAIEALLKQLPPGYRIGEIAREVRQCKGHQAPVFDVAFSPDGRMLASCSQDGVTKIWDVKTGKTIRTLQANTNPVWSVAFSPDSRHVATGGFDKTIRIWDLTSGRVIRSLTGHGDYIRGVVFSPDGKQIVSCGDDRTVRVWDIEEGVEIRRLADHDHYVWDVDLSRDGNLIASACLDRVIRLWPTDSNSDNKKQRLKGHTDTVLAVAIAPSGRQVLSTGSDKTIRLWDTNTGKELMQLRGHTGFVTTVAVTPDGRRALSGGYDGTLRLWDLETGDELRVLEGLNGRIWAVAFSRDGRLAASAGDDGLVRIWGGKE